ncbi:MAG: ligase-associated DNA damage response endonuclease PdeM [Chitinophagaceae bacterium]|jgi:DNA ligase-associated metallophosphoesterase|nr:ligase-associated DNA damage response endonuclease PdeM [Chitinophagaceae bacterium]
MATAHSWHGNTFWLHGERVMLWEETQTLIASDLHLGKTGHFRKSGIAVPQELMKQDLMRLFAVLQHFRPERLLVVGDFFHSHANKELDWFARWRKDLSQLQILLVKGNHDILPAAWYQQNQIGCVDHWEEREIRFVHEPGALEADDLPTICGHIHPGISIRGAGRQSLRMPCFYFSEKHCILPAFSLFTGTHAIKPKRADAVFAIAEQKIIPLA